MKRLLGYTLMGVYTVMIIVGILFSIDSMTSLSTALAIISFILIQQPGKKGVVDEREKFIVHRAASASYMTLITVLVFGSVFNDLIEFLNYVSIEEIFQIIVGLGYMTFVSMYVYYSEKI